jgi:hypothetical protein
VTKIPEPEYRGRRNWTDKPVGEKKAVYKNRRRTKGNRGKRLQKKRSEYVERSFAHICETGGARRCWLRGIEKVRKRYVITTAARNLGRIMRHLFGVGTARSLQGAGASFYCLYIAIMNAMRRHMRSPQSIEVQHWSCKSKNGLNVDKPRLTIVGLIGSFSTGC